MKYTDRLRSFVTSDFELEGKDSSFGTVKEIPFALQNIFLWLTMH